MQKDQFHLEYYAFQYNKIDDIVKWPVLDLNFSKKIYINDITKKKSIPQLIKVMVILSHNPFTGKK